MKSSNLLLAALDPEARALLSADRIQLVQHLTIQKAAVSPEFVLFPESGLLSLISRLETGASVQIATVGPEGALGVSLNDSRLPVNLSWMVQLPGTALRVRRMDFHAIAHRSEPLMRLALQAETRFVMSLMRSAACNGLHSLEQRLCRALLEACECNGDDQVQLTQSFLSQMLGVQRTTISMVAQDLQNDGIIHYRRGSIAVIEKERLVQRACDCHLAFPSQLAATASSPIAAKAFSPDNR